MATGEVLGTFAIFVRITKKPLHDISLYKRVSIRIRNEMYQTEKRTCRNHCLCSLNMQILVKRKAAFTRTRFHLKPHRFRCGYAFCLHDTDRERCRNRVYLKTLPKVGHFQNDTVSYVVYTAKPHRFEYGYHYGAKFAFFDSKW